MESMHFVIYTKFSFLHFLGVSSYSGPLITTIGVHILATEVFKFNFLNFYIAETRLYILSKFVQFTLNKQYSMQIKFL